MYNRNHNVIVRVQKENFIVRLYDYMALKLIFFSKKKNKLCCYEKKML